MRFQHLCLQARLGRPVLGIAGWWVRRLYGDDGAGGHQHDQSALCPGHIEIGPDLRAIVSERLRIGSHIAFPIHNDARVTFGRQRQRVRDAVCYRFSPIERLRGIDRKLGQKIRPQGRDVRQRQGSDIADLTSRDLPGIADFLWASSPCTDTSSAGHGAGIHGASSRAVFEVLRLIRELDAEGRAPGVIVIENVMGLASRFDHTNLVELAAKFVELGYRVGALACDAALFVPQSRRRIFIVAVRNDVDVPLGLAALGPDPRWHPAAIVGAYNDLPPAHKAQWCWWTLPVPPQRKSHLADVLLSPNEVKWGSVAKTRSRLKKMSPVNKEKVAASRRKGGLVVGAMSRRTRSDGPRFEVRFDGLAGCLRPPKGGSSRQELLFVKGRSTRSRFLAPREAARLMGLPDSYKLPAVNTAAMTLLGDGVAVPVVSHLFEHLLRPMLLAVRAPLSVVA